MPQIANSAIGRSLLLAQFSARPWRLSPDVVLEEMRSFVESPVFDELLHNLAYGEEQKGAPPGSIGNRSSSAGGGATGLPFRANRNTRWKSFPMHSFTGSTAAGIFRNGTGRRKPSG
jgi:hypothetical protein